MQSLGKWCDMQVTDEQLDMLGVSDMKYVSGTGEYTISFTLPDDFGENDGAFIAYSYGRDQVGALIVNGTELPANNASDRVDVGTLLTAGQNTLTIRLNSTLYGRTYFEHSGYLDNGAVYGMGEGVPTKLKAISAHAFYSCDGLEEVLIPNGVLSIGDYAFSSCQHLTLITIPNSVTSIGKSAFSSCWAIKTVVIPNSVTSLSSNAFYNCVNLSSVILSDQLTNIETKSFHHCRSLKTINVPASVQSIEESAFTDCDNLKELRVLSTTPPTMPEGAFNNYDLVLKVPASALTAYSNTEPWIKFTTKVALTDEDLVIKKCATPTITYTEDGELVFNCETEGVDFLYNFSSSGSSLGNKAVLTDNLIVTVYAVKSGYANSEPVTAEFTAKGRLGDLNGDGKVDVADHVKLSSIIMNP